MKYIHLENYFYCVSIKLFSESLFPVLDVKAERCGLGMGRYDASVFYSVAHTVGLNRIFYVIEQKYNILLTNWMLNCGDLLKLIKYFPLLEFEYFVGAFASKLTILFIESFKESVIQLVSSTSHQSVSALKEVR